MTGAAAPPRKSTETSHRLVYWDLQFDVGLGTLCYQGARVGVLPWAAERSRYMLNRVGQCVLISLSHSPLLRECCLVRRQVLMDVTVAVWELSISDDAFLLPSTSVLCSIIVFEKSQGEMTFILENRNI